MSTTAGRLAMTMACVILLASFDLRALLYDDEECSNGVQDESKSDSTTTTTTIGLLRNSRVPSRAAGAIAPPSSSESSSLFLLQFLFRRSSSSSFLHDCPCFEGERQESSSFLRTRMRVYRSRRKRGAMSGSSPPSSRPRCHRSPFLLLGVDALACLDQTLNVDANQPFYLNAADNNAGVGASVHALLRCTIIGALTLYVNTTNVQISFSNIFAPETHISFLNAPGKNGQDIVGLSISMRNVDFSSTTARSPTLRGSATHMDFLGIYGTTRNLQLTITNVTVRMQPSPVGSIQYAHIIRCEDRITDSDIQIDNMTIVASGVKDFIEILYFDEPIVRSTVNMSRLMVATQSRGARMLLTYHAIETQFFLEKSRFQSIEVNADVFVLGSLGTAINSTWTIDDSAMRVVMRLPTDFDSNLLSKSGSELIKYITENYPKGTILGVVCASNVSALFRRSDVAITLAEGRDIIAAVTVNIAGMKEVASLNVTVLESNLTAYTTKPCAQLGIAQLQSVASDLTVRMFRSNIMVTAEKFILSAIGADVVREAGVPGTVGIKEWRPVDWIFSCRFPSPFQPSRGRFADRSNVFSWTVQQSTLKGVAHGSFGLPQTNVSLAMDVQLDRVNITGGLMRPGAQLTQEENAKMTVRHRTDINQASCVAVRDETGDDVPSIATTVASYDPLSSSNPFVVLTSMAELQRFIIGGYYNPTQWTLAIAPSVVFPCPTASLPTSTSTTITTTASTTSTTQVEKSTTALAATTTTTRAPPPTTTRRPRTRTVPLSRTISVSLSPRFTPTADLTLTAALPKTASRRLTHSATLIPRVFMEVAVQASETLTAVALVTSSSSSLIASSGVGAVQMSRVASLSSLSRCGNSNNGGAAAASASNGPDDGVSPTVQTVPELPASEHPTGILFGPALGGVADILLSAAVMNSVLLIALVFIYMSVVKLVQKFRTQELVPALALSKFPSLLFSPIMLFTQPTMGNAIAVVVYRTGGSPGGKVLAIIPIIVIATFQVGMIAAVTGGFKAHWHALPPPKKPLVSNNKTTSRSRAGGGGKGGRGTNGEEGVPLKDDHSRLGGPQQENKEVDEEDDQDARDEAEARRQADLAMGKVPTTTMGTSAGGGGLSSASGGGGTTPHWIERVTTAWGNYLAVQGLWLNRKVKLPNRNKKKNVPPPGTVVIVSKNAGGKNDEDNADDVQEELEKADEAIPANGLDVVNKKFFPTSFGDFPFVSCFAPLFDPMREGRQWFVTLDIVMADVLTFSYVGSLSTSPNCNAVSIIVVAAMMAYCAAVIYLNPFNNRFETHFGIFGAIVEVGIAMAGAVGALFPARADAAAVAGSIMSNVLLGITVVRVLVDVVTMGHRYAIDAYNVALRKARVAVRLANEKMAEKARLIALKMQRDSSDEEDDKGRQLIPDEIASENGSDGSDDENAKHYLPPEEHLERIREAHDVQRRMLEEQRWTFDSILTALPPPHPPSSSAGATYHSSGATSAAGAAGGATKGSNNCAAAVPQPFVVTYVGGTPPPTRRRDAPPFRSKNREEDGKKGTAASMEHAMKAHVDVQDADVEDLHLAAADPITREDGGAAKKVEPSAVTIHKVAAAVLDLLEPPATARKTTNVIAPGAVVAPSLGRDQDKAATVSHGKKKKKHKKKRQDADGTMGSSHDVTNTITRKKEEEEDHSSLHRKALSPTAEPNTTPNTGRRESIHGGGDANEFVLQVGPSQRPLLSESPPPSLTATLRHTSSSDGLDVTSQGLGPRPGLPTSARGNDDADDDDLHLLDNDVLPNRTANQDHVPTSLIAEEVKSDHVNTTNNEREQPRPNPGGEELRLGLSSDFDDDPLAGKRSSGRDAAAHSRLADPDAAIL